MAHRMLNLWKDHMKANWVSLSYLIQSWEPHPDKNSGIIWGIDDI